MARATDFWGVDVAQGDDFPHVMMRIEAPLFEFEVVGLGPRRQRQKPQEELVSAGLFAVLQERLGVIGVFNVLEPLVASGVAGNERVPVVEAEPIGRGFERECLAGVVGWHGVAVRVQGNAKLPGGSDLRDRGGIKRMQRQRAQRRPLLVP